MSTPQPSPTGPRQHPRKSRRTAAITLGVVAAIGLATVLPAAADGRLSGWLRSDDAAVAVTQGAAPAKPSDPAMPDPATSAAATKPAADAGTSANKPGADSGPATSPSAAPKAAAPKAAAPKAATPAAAAGTCASTASAKPKVRVTQINAGVTVKGYGGEGDTEPLPLAIAARPGGSWVAWLGTNKRVYLGKLNCADKLVGKPTSFPGIDLQDVKADSTGGVLLLTRPGSCKGSKLCGGSASPCNTMYMVRFNNAGALVWQVQVTNLTANRGGQTNGARFVWWYQHHGRLAYDGKNYAAYFGVAITVQNGNCVDIHQGDRMQVVSKGGKLLSGHNSFEVGCSHAWGSRIVWDKRVNRFVMVCATDNNCRIAQPNPYRTVAAGACDGTLFGGDLVNASTTGYWTAWSQGGKIRLERFTTGASNKTVRTGISSSHPHLVRYGKGRMLLAWQSGTGIAAQVYNASTGAPIGARIKIPVRDHSFAAFKDFSDTSVAYAAAGSTGTKIKIARVMPMG